MDDHQPPGAGGPSTLSTFGPYRLLSTISTGARGTVHEAFDPESRRRIALRVVPLRPGHARRGLLQRWRLKRRGLAVSRLQHPNIVAWLAQGQVDGSSFVATEFVDGVPLTTYLAGVGHLPVLQGLALSAQLLAALAFAHGRRQLHGAIQPGNLLVSRTGQLKVAGFGWAAGEPGAPVPGRFHEPCYLAPEQGRGAPADARADLYSAALVARLLLGGGPPDRPTAALPPKLAAVFERALAVQPRQRYRDAASLRAALQDAVGEPVWDRAELRAPIVPDAAARPQAPAAHVTDPALHSAERPPREAAAADPPQREVTTTTQPAGWKPAETAVFTRFASAPTAAVESTTLQTGPAAPPAAQAGVMGAPDTQRLRPAPDTAHRVDSPRKDRASATLGAVAASTPYAAAVEQRRPPRRRALAGAAVAAVLALGLAWVLHEPAPQQAVATASDPAPVPVPPPISSAGPAQERPVAPGAQAPVHTAPAPMATAPVVGQAPGTLVGQAPGTAVGPAPGTVVRQAPGTPQPPAAQVHRGDPVAGTGQAVAAGQANRPPAANTPGVPQQQSRAEAAPARPTEATRATRPVGATDNTTARPQQDEQRTARANAARGQPSKASKPNSASPPNSPSPSSPPQARAPQRGPLAIVIDPHVGCRQDLAVTREVCKAIRCASSEFARHPVCVRRMAEQRQREAERELHGGGG